jgi:hypothetical protein
MTDARRLLQARHSSEPLISSSLVTVPFIYFSCPIALARITRAALNKCSESRHPCLVPDLRKTLSFPPLNIMLAVFSFSRDTFYQVKKVSF